MAIGLFLSLFGIETRGELRLRMPEPVRFGSRPRFSRSTGGQNRCQFRSRPCGIIVSIPQTATGFGAGPVFLRCQRERAEIPNCRHGGRNCCRPSFCSLALGIKDREVELSRRQWDSETRGRHRFPGHLWSLGAASTLTIGCILCREVLLSSSVMPRSRILPITP